jgi:hypothetical protein
MRRPVSFCSMMCAAQPAVRAQVNIEGVMAAGICANLAEGHVADELLDVHASVAERAAVLVGLGDLGLGLERNHAF